MKRFTYAGVLVAAALAAGCLSSSTVVTVKADGSGTIEQRTMMSASALNMMASMGGEKAKPGQMFDEESLRRTAEKLGPGVRLVSTTPVEEGGMKGANAVFVFDDINTVRVSESPSMPGMGDAAAESKPRMAFKLVRSGAGHVLTITMPKDDAKGTEQAEAPADEPDTPDMSKDVPPEAMNMMKMMLKGLHVSVVVVVDGTITKTNAPFHTDQAVTLADVNFDELMQDENAFKAIQGKMGPGTSPAEMQAIMKNMKGVKVNTEPVVTIEWK